MGSLLLKLIIEQLDQYVRSVESPINNVADKRVVLGNIGASRFAGGEGGNANNPLEDRVVVTLVNIAEEGSLKNNTSMRVVNQQAIQYNPVVHVNLYLLFTANFDIYDTAVNHLFRVLEFFQGRKIFKFKNAPLAGGLTGDEQQIEEIELTMDLHTLSFEQLNDLWGSLGGKQMPFVLYRARLVPVQMEKPILRESLVREIDLATKKMESF
ncbi:MAG: DUF4255 domain-containing protein [Saprospiraceae bacterium]|nr:DUF4255 domain-containing protein [Saprospiraceae bacterium]